MECKEGSVSGTWFKMSIYRKKRKKVLFDYLSNKIDKIFVVFIIKNREQIRRKWERR